MTSQSSYVVVVTLPDGRVGAVLGPREDRESALAIAQTVRLEGAQAHVRPVREPDVSDMHARGVYRDAE